DTEDGDVEDASGSSGGHLAGVRLPHCAELLPWMFSMPLAREVLGSILGCAYCLRACGSNNKEMVTKKHRAALTREGYRLVGSHSAVKLCRWTKHQVRGRGGCYKHSFYGIESH
ncbi:S-adenosyl-L-methionine-dependent tRNA 4-demethylwyosine synthase, partial [Perkinsus olseni]